MATVTGYQIDEEGASSRSEVKSFPCKLMQILDDNCFPDIIQWLPHGRGFVISDRNRFAEEVLPKYFPKKSKFSSFNRKLNRWKFVKQIQGRRRATYFHPLFVRGNQRSCLQMCPEAQTPVSRSPPLIGNRSPDVFGSLLTGDRNTRRNISSLSPSRFAEPMAERNRSSQIPSLDVNTVSISPHESLHLRRRFTMSQEESSHLTTYMNMSFLQIQALQRSLERELMVTSIEMEDLRTENLNRVIPESRRSPRAHKGKKERRPSMGARAA